MGLLLCSLVLLVSGCTTHRFVHPSCPRLHREVESDTVQVLYRRSSEGYGVLVPRKRE